MGRGGNQRVTQCFADVERRRGRFGASWCKRNLYPYPEWTQTRPRAVYHTGSMLASAKLRGATNVGCTGIQVPLSACLRGTRRHPEVGRGSLGRARDNPAGSRIGYCAGFLARGSLSLWLPPHSATASSWFGPSPNQGGALLRTTRLFFERLEGTCSTGQLHGGVPIKTSRLPIRDLT